MGKRKLTPKQWVRRKFPEAYAVVCWFTGPTRWHVWANHKLSGRGGTAAKAWSDAARRLKGGK